MYSPSSRLTGGVIAWSTANGESPVGGDIFPNNELKIMSLDGKDEVKPDQQGELWIRGPNVAKGYWQNPAATGEAFVDGWLRTGDVATVDSQGRLFVAGRKCVIPQSLCAVRQLGLKLMAHQGPDCRQSGTVPPGTATAFASRRQSRCVSNGGLNNGRQEDCSRVHHQTRGQQPG